MSAAAQRQVIPFRQRTQRLKFSKRSIASIKPPSAGRVYVYDASTPSLAVCVTAAGRRTFYVVRKVNGRATRLKLGAFPEISVETARKLTAKNLAKIADGRDPQAERRLARAESTFGEAFTRYLDQRAKPHNRTWRVAEQRHGRHVAGWSGRKLSTITRADVQALHAKLGADSGHYEANRVLALLSAVFNVAADAGWEGANPCRGVKKFRERSRDRFLQADELPRFLEASEADQNPDTGDFFKLALLTGCRVGNLMAAEWSHMLLADQVWRIPETKSGEWQRVHLPAEAVAILTARRARLESEAAADERELSPFVFPSRAGTKTGHLTDITKPWARVCKAAGLDDIRPHDLRRTLGSWQAATGASLHVIGKSLGHSQPNTTAIYARLNLDPVKAAVDTAVGAMLARAKGPVAAN